MTDTSLTSAVQTRKLTTRQGLLQRLFAVWFDAFVYNQIWEDPRVDVQALRLDQSSRILTISSGGCNALNYLLESPAAVTAVDLNRHHIFVLNLKLAALKHLPSYEAFFEFFGCGRGKYTGANYLRHIAPNLDKETRSFWESNTVAGSLLYGDRISFFSNAGLYDHSRNGYFLRFFHRVAKLSGCSPEKVLYARSRDEQRSLYEQHIEPFFKSPLIGLAGRSPITMFGLGIPPQQYEELEASLDDGATVIDLYRERVRKLACDFPIDENYFAWQAFARRYDVVDRKAVPDYLKQENYDRLKANAQRLNTIVGSATAVIRNGERGQFNRFVLLDAQDWMEADQLTDLWSAVAERAEPRSRIIFRTAGTSSPVEKCLPPTLRAAFRYDADLSKALFAQDRSSIYGGFHIYEFAG